MLTKGSYNCQNHHSTLKCLFVMLVSSRTQLATMHLCSLLFATVLLAFIRPATGSPSNAGSEFYVGFMKALDREQSPLTISIRVTTTESLPVHFTVSDSTTTIHSGTAHNSSVTEIVLSNSYVVSNITERNKGLQMQVTEAGKTIIAYGINYRSKSADGFLVLPCNNYQVENYTYFAVSTLFNRTSLRSSSEVLLVGCEDTTEVTIIPTQTIQIPSDLVREGNSAITVPPGESYTVTLNRMQTYQFSSLLDLTGSKVISNKPVAFFSGHECADVPINTPACDHLVEQLPPTITWGQLFFTASLKGRNSGEWYKVISSRSATSVVVHCSLIGRSNFIINLIRAGSSHEFNIGQNMFCSIQANKPVMVVQFATGGTLELSYYGDPFMMMIPPVEQYKSSFTFVSQSNFNNFLTITVPVQFYNPSMIVLNGTALTSTLWTPISCSSVDICGYATQTSISIGINYIQHLNPDAVFGVVVYGFDTDVSYGYPAGMELTSNQTETVGVGPYTDEIRVTLATSESSSVAENILVPAVVGSIAAVVVAVITVVALVVIIIVARHHFRNRPSATNTKTSTEIPMAENIAYREIKKKQLQQNIDEHEYETVT